MTKFKSLARQYCAIVKINQKKTQAKEAIKSYHSVTALQLEKKDHWLNMFIGNCDLQVVYNNNT